ncbi:MAG: hypothetical protein H6918_09810 [Sphingomonadaceae bacterium]|nr:hypothetical protein [Sphingomonadaceae bacterium]
MAGIEFVYDGGDARLETAIGHATSLLRSTHFRSIIENRPTPFFNTTRSCTEIARAIFECDAQIRITMFSKKPRFGTLTTGYADPNVADTIFFNTYALDRSVAANINTLVHEAVHIVDKFHDRVGGFDFTHKGNKPFKPPQNQDSAPYWIGNRCVDLLPLLQDSTKSAFGLASLDDLAIEDVTAALTETNWAGEEGSTCGTHAEEEEEEE